MVCVAADAGWAASTQLSICPADSVRLRLRGLAAISRLETARGSATGGEYHALLWNGSAASYVDLHQFLPTGFVSSYAEGIDSYGNIVGEAEDSLGNAYAIVWVVPEPATMVLLGWEGYCCGKESTNSEARNKLELPKKNKS